MSNPIELATAGCNVDSVKPAKKRGSSLMAKVSATAMVAMFAAFGYYLADLLEFWARLSVQNPHMPEITSLWPAVFISVALVALRYLITRLLAPVGRALLPQKKWAPIEFEKRVERFSHVSFKFIYFLFSTIIGWMMLKDMDWMPPSMGGSGTVSNCWTNWPQRPMPDVVRTYYIVSLGYHLHSVLYQLGTSKRNDFWEMILHHTLTLILVTSSYLLNHFRTGTLVFWLHDCGDISAYWIKAFVDTRYTSVTLTAYAALLISWGYLRLYVFPFEVLASLHTDYQTDLPGLQMFVTLLYTLVALHVYWYSKFLMMGYTFAVTGRAEDVIDDMKTDRALKTVDAKPHKRSVAPGTRRKAD